jgi:hypothetical protein
MQLDATSEVDKEDIYTRAQALLQMKDTSSSTASSSIAVKTA